MNDTYGSTLESVRQELAARAATESPASDRTSVLSARGRSAPFRSLARAFSFGVLGVLLAALAMVAVATVPGLFGYHTYAIDGASMEPTLSVGDVAVSKLARPDSLEVGDVIVRRDTQGGQPVLHRIVEVVEVDGQLAFITQGDQNNAPDVQPVILSGSGEQVLYTVPYAGYVLSFAKSWQGRLLLIGLPFVLLVAALAGDVRRASPSKRRAVDASAEPQEHAATPNVGHQAQLHSWALRRFVLRHSGGYHHIRQCAEHPPIAGMATLQVLAALRQETGIAVTSQRLAETCAELEVPYARTASEGIQGHRQRAA